MQGENEHNGLWEYTLLHDIGVEPPYSTQQIVRLYEVMGRLEGRERLVLERIYKDNAGIATVAKKLSVFEINIERILLNSKIKLGVSDAQSYIKLGTGTYKDRIAEEERFNSPIDRLNLSTGAQAILLRNGISSIGLLASAIKSGKALQFKNMGTIKYSEIINKLRAYAQGTSDQELASLCSTPAVKEYKGKKAEAEFTEAAKQTIAQPENGETKLLEIRELTRRMEQLYDEVKIGSTENYETVERIVYLGLKKKAICTKLKLSMNSIDFLNVLVKAMRLLMKDYVCELPPGILEDMRSKIYNTYGSGALNLFENKRKSGITNGQLIKELLERHGVNYNTFIYRLFNGCWDTDNPIELIAMALVKVGTARHYSYVNRLTKASHKYSCLLAISYLNHIHMEAFNSYNGRQATKLI